MDVNEIFTNKAFDCLETERKEAFRYLFAELKNKTPEQAVPIIMRFMQSMPKGHKITPQQRDDMLAAVTADMNEREKQNVETIMKILL